VLAFDRGDHLSCVTNLSPGPVVLPRHTALLLTSGPLTDGLLPADTSVWLRTT
jgi:alpha-glucosidase